MAMSPVLLRPRRKAPAFVDPFAPSGVTLTTAPRAPDGVTLTTAPLAPASIGLTSQPSNLVVQEVFAPDTPTGVTASPAANAPSAPTNVSLATVPSAPTSIGLTGQPGNVVVQEVFAPDAPTGVTLTPQSTDPYFADVSLLLQESLADESSNGLTLTQYGGIALDSTTYKYGSYSLYFDGTDDSLQATVDSTLHVTTDVTIEFWMKSSRTADQRIIMSRRNSNSATDLLMVSISSQKIVARYDGSSLLTSSTNVPDGNWHYVSVVKDGTLFSLYIDGAVEDTASVSALTSYNPIGLAFNIGRDSVGAAQFYQGHLDGFRFTNGVARYSGSTHTVPVASLPTS